MPSFDAGGWLVVGNIELLCKKFTHVLNVVDLRVDNPVAVTMQVIVPDIARHDARQAWMQRLEVMAAKNLHESMIELLTGWG
jgi:hypothetical protein